MNVLRSAVNNVAGFVALAGAVKDKLAQSGTRCNRNRDGVWRVVLVDLEQHCAVDGFQANNVHMAIISTGVALCA
jgi:hypothetical protein